MKYTTEIPSFSLQWPPPPTHKVFNLAMIGQKVLQYGPNEEIVRLLLKGDVTTVMSSSGEVTLEQISASLLTNRHHGRSRKVIIIEGAPGAGKSTLAWHLCQKWETRELFKEFEIVLFVQLRDPNIHSAESLEDIFPGEKSRKSKIVSALKQRNGHQALLVFDSWDEFPFRLHEDSIITKIICKPQDVCLELSALVITSRPIATCELQKYASSRVEIVGFKQAEVKHYFTEVLGDPETVQKLEDHLRERPVIETSCYLPLNAAIVAHLFLTGNHTLPTSLHGVFTLLVICIIVRHLKKQAGEGHKEPSILSLDDIPPDIKDPFNSICNLAYQGVMKNKVTFSARDLQLLQLPTELSTLSLIQGVESFTAISTSKIYNFLHLSIQELLAAFHISKMQTEVQLEIFKTLLEQPRFSAVFQYYVAFTKLRNEAVRGILVSVLQRKSKDLLLSIVDGLYEAQDLPLCQFVAFQLCGELNLATKSLNPYNCLSLGYFLRSVCLTTSKKFKVNLYRCQIDDYSINLIVKELSSKCISAHACPAMGVNCLGHLEIEYVVNCMYISVSDTKSSFCCVCDM